MGDFDTCLRPRLPPVHMCLGGARPVIVVSTVVGAVCRACLGPCPPNVLPRAKTPLPLRLRPEGLQSMLGSSGSISCAGVSRDTRRNRPNKLCICPRRDSLESLQNAPVLVSETLRVWWPHFSTLYFKVLSACSRFFRALHLVARACALHRMLVACLLNSPYYSMKPTLCTTPR